MRVGERCASALAPALLKSFVQNNFRSFHAPSTPSYVAGNTSANTPVRNEGIFFWQNQDR